MSLLLPFSADALSYLASVLSLFWIRSNFQQERTTVPRRLHREVIDGLAWFWHQPLLRIMAILSWGINLVVVGGSSLLVIVLAQHQHASSFSIGLLFACARVGGIPGSLLVPFLQKHLSFGQMIIGNTRILALLWPLYTAVPNIVTLGNLTTILFFLGPIYNVVNASYRLAFVPDAFLGRVNSAVRFISFASQPPGLTTTGVLIQNIGTSKTVLLGTGILLFVALSATMSSHVCNAPQITEKIM